MGCKYRCVAQAVDEFLDILQRDFIVMKSLQRVLEGAWPQAAATANLAPAPTVCNGLLGEIDETEVGAESANYQFQGGGVQRVDEVYQSSPFFRVVLFSQANKTGSQRFNRLIDQFSAMGTDGLAKHAAKQLDSGTKQLVIVSSRASRTGYHRGCL